MLKVWYLQAFWVRCCLLLSTDVKEQLVDNVSGADLHREHSNIQWMFSFFFGFWHVSFSLVAAWKCHCTCFLHCGQVFVGAVWNHLRRLEERRRQGTISSLKHQQCALLLKIWPSCVRLPFIVESVSAVDGRNISGVIEEIGANRAVCSDRHLAVRRVALLWIAAAVLVDVHSGLLSLMTVFVCVSCKHLP